jgi:reactive intermediate/imine deaminase
MAKQIINPSSIPTPMGPYSQGVVATGRKLIFISGQVPEDAHGNVVGEGDIEAQTRQVLANVKIMVEEAGGSIADIVKITVFMVEISSSAYEWVSKLRKQFFGGDYPTSTMVEVKRLARPEWLIEIEAWAVV